MVATRTPTPPRPAAFAEPLQRTVEGDFGAAAEAWRRVLASAGLTPEQTAEARFRLAEALARDGRGADALETLGPETPASSPRDAYFRGLALLANGQHAEGVERMARFATANPLVAPAVYLEIAEAELAARRPREAAEAAALGLADASARGLRVRLLEVRGQALAALGDVEAAFDADRQVLALAGTRATLGEQLFRLARASRDLGKRDEAVRALQTALEDFPNASTTGEALRLLDALGAADTVDPYVLGRARLAAGDLRNAALAFGKSLQADPEGPDAPSARLYRALASLGPGNEEAALRELAQIAEDPQQESEVAATAFLEAGQALEGLGLLERAEERYQALLQRFPRLDAAATGAFRLGLARYVRGALAESVAAWDGLLQRAAELPPAEVSRAHYWRGKALARLGRDGDARAAWERAAAVRPTDFYTLRAAEALGRLRASSGTAQITADDHAALVRWLGQRGQDLAAAEQAVSADPSLQRAQELTGLGLYRQGNWEAEELVQRYPDRTDRLYVLARAFAEAGLTAGATRLGQAALAALAEEAAAEAPAALLKAAYPRPFAQLVDRVGEKYGVDPLLVDASLRTASGFDPWAESAASGARGLARMAPVHVEEAARGLGITSPTRLLTRPVVAVDMFTWYLARRLQRLDGRPEAALAAIGFGDRTADNWLARQGVDDPDLFVERMDWEDTRAALRDQLATRLRYAQVYGTGAAGASPLAPSLPKPEPTERATKIARFAADLPPAAPQSPAATVGDDRQRATFAQAWLLQRDGDHEAAASLLRPLAEASDAAVRSAAQLRLGEALLAAGRSADAVAPLEAAAQAAPGTSASFLLARAQSEIGRCDLALPQYERFVSAAAGPLAAQGRVAMAGCLESLGRAQDAVSQVQQATAVEGLPRLQVLAFRERLALARVRAGDVAGARAEYESLLAGARSPAYRSDLHYFLGIVAPDAAAAADHFRSSVQAQPTNRAAQAALDELAALRDPFARSFEAGETRFEQDRYREALLAYDAALAAAPGGPNAAAARYGRGVSLVRLGQDRAGIAALQEIARAHPGTEAAADGLFRAGRVLESIADLSAARAAYASVLAQPNGGGQRATEAQFRLAFADFRLSDFARAAAAWRELAGGARTAEERAQAQFWLGKALRAAGDEAGARAAWTTGADVDPGGYYSLRASDYLAGREGNPAPRADLQRAVPLVAGQVNASVEAELRSWAATQGDVASAEASLRADPALARAEQLLALGLRREATWELESLAERLGRDTVRLALLAGWEHTRGFYNPALIQAYTIAGNANVNLRRGAPAVRKLVYPVPHPAVLAKAGEEQRADPLLLSALMRQESALDQYVESPAQARGLTQLIASTAYEAARALGRYDFRTAELFQPKTSITLGAYTFARRLERYGQLIFPALAAYNADQYSVDAWLLAAGESDIDTFAESIPFTETYPYVQTIYENYRQYLELYATP